MHGLGRILIRDITAADHAVYSSCVQGLAVIEPDIPAQGVGAAPASYRLLRR